MQIFVPYPSPLQCAVSLWNDQRRYNKQIIECKQILDAIDGVGKGWFNHPVTKMYKPYREWLVNYNCCLMAYRNCMKYKKDDDFATRVSYIQATMYSDKADAIRPSFLTDEFCNQHKRRLFTKAPDLYPQFAEYGTNEENWYVIDGEIVKYLNGKKL